MEDAIYEVGKWGSPRPGDILKYMEDLWVRTGGIKHRTKKAFPFGGEDEFMPHGTVSFWAKEDEVEISTDYTGLARLVRQTGALKIYRRRQRSRRVHE